MLPLVGTASPEYPDFCAAVTLNVQPLPFALLGLLVLDETIVASPMLAPELPVVPVAEYGQPVVGATVDQVPATCTAATLLLAPATTDILAVHVTWRQQTAVAAATPEQRWTRRGMTA